MPLWLLLIFLCVIPCNCCSNVSKGECKANRNNYCYCKDSTIIGCNITSYSSFRDCLSRCRNARFNVTSIRIYNATIENFDLRLEEYSKLQSLSIINGKIRKLQGRFFSNNNLTCMNLSGNGIIDINAETFTKLSELKTLDVSRNNLTKIPSIIQNRKKDLSLDISRGNKIRCKDIVNLLIKLRNDSSTTNVTFNNKESTNCLTERSFHWFNSTDVMPLSQILEQITLDEACPSGMNSSCTCRAYWTDYLISNSKPAAKFSVNCSNLQLTELPPLPANIIYLDVSNNQIKSLELLATNKNYSEVREFVADNNKIESIVILEGSQFIDNFNVLSLRNNQIKSIPTYILSKAFDRNNFHQRIVKFGENKLNCDCSTALTKMWLLNNKHYIQDYDEVQCDKDFQRVIDIDPSRVCIHEKDLTDYIYFIIAGEIILLILLVSKVTYDYWVFKSSGYLPWPASKMPKLPCDWCFET
ncbi:protein halfway [Halyomorpha halys]|uniref:protein halfway n=1 Tax=Halyomorpha halys TaxID=286706 RepID=UPI0006D5201F|nr:protein halfway [Halyomorpha halys]